MIPSEMSRIFERSGAQPPADPSFFEISSRCSLYVNVSIGTQIFELSQPLASETRAVCCLISFKPTAQGVSSQEAVLEWMKVVLEDEITQRGIAVRCTAQDNCLCVVVPWPMRYEFKSAMDEVLVCEAFHRAISSLMEDDFVIDDAALRSIHEQSRSGMFSSIASLFVRHERSWAFSHFNVTQTKVDASYRWVIDMGSDLYLLDAIDEFWRKRASAGLLKRLDLRSAVSADEFESAPTWIAQSVEIRSIGATAQDIRDFSNFLRAFVGTFYLQEPQAFLVTAPGQGIASELSAISAF